MWNQKSSNHRKTAQNDGCQRLGVWEMGTYYSRDTKFQLRKMNGFGDLMYSNVTTINNTVLYT